MSDSPVNDESPKTPMLDKMLSIGANSQMVGEFITWLHENGLFICEESDGESGIFSRPGYHPTPKNIEQLLAGFFEIDLEQVEAERMLVLESIRGASS